MSQQPIYVMAARRQTAENFIFTDMSEDPKRLRYIDDPERLRGLRGFMLYIHPTSDQLPRRNEILEVARQHGLILCYVDDTWARELHARGMRR